MRDKKKGWETPAFLSCNHYLVTEMEQKIADRKGRITSNVHRPSLFKNRPGTSAVVHAERFPHGSISPAGKGLSGTPTPW